MNYKKRISVYCTVRELAEVTKFANQYSKGVLAHFVMQACVHYMKFLAEKKIEIETKT